MLAGNWFGKKRLFAKARKQHRPLSKAPRRKEAGLGRNLRVEELEDRRMLATFIVNNLGDLVPDGTATEVGTLRQAIELANADEDFDTIVFADFLFTDPFTRETNPGAIFLDPRENGRQIEITQPLQILGPGASTLTIFGSGNNQRIFETNIGSDDELFTVSIGGVTLAGGNLTGTADSDDNRGGAIFNRERLSLIETELVNNNASWGGGAVYSPIGNVTVTRSTFVDNTSGGGGGAILLGTGDEEVRPQMTVDSSTFTGNQTFTVGTTDPQPGLGGGIYNRGGNTAISHSTFTGNSASVGGGAVATNGVDLGDGEDDLPPPIVTSLTHNVLIGNGADDLFAVRQVFDGNEPTLLAPTMLIDGPGLGYNVIGNIGGTTFWDSTDEENPGNDHFYQALRNGDGEAISWRLANLYATFGQTDPPIPDPLPEDLEDLPPLQSSHLATPSTMEENLLVAEVASDPSLWQYFQPTVTVTIVIPPMDPDDPDDMGMEMDIEVPTTPPESIGPWLGGFQGDTSSEPLDGWEWVTNPREEWLYTNWYQAEMGDPPVVPTQPNNGMREGVEEVGPSEEFLHYFGPAGEGEGNVIPTDTWGDSANEPEDGASPIAFVIEYDKGTNLINVDPQLLPLDYYGGPTRTFYPNSALDSPLIDGGDPMVVPNPLAHDQRGVHFTRFYDADLDDGAIIGDIGAVEVQNGSFTVDTLWDESDGQYTVAFGEDGVIGVLSAPQWYLTRGDFALREAIEFSELNPEFDVIDFSDSLLDLDDPTSSSPPTILLQLSSDIDVRSAFSVSRSVTIIGPTGFELEVDATGNDETPTVNNSDGTRIFLVDDFSASNELQVAISGLTLLGGDVVGEGGAILSREDLNLDRVSIKENSASTGGGGISTSEGELIITSSALFDNVAGFEGGALKIAAATPGNLSRATVRNSTISGNLGARGSGILNEDGELIVEFSTITDNTGPIGAGIANLNNPNTFTQVNSSIVSANNGSDIRIVNQAVPNVQSLGFNIVGTGNALAVFNQPGDQPGVVDPMISPLVFDGAFTPVHRLLPGSPAIDTGESTAVEGVGNVPLTDQRGNPFTRVFDGVQDTKDRIDIGAYELQGTTFLVDSPFDEDDGVISTGNLSLREAVNLSNSNPLPDVIMFDAGQLAGATIFQASKNSGPLQPGTPTDIRITDSVTIVGLGDNLLTLDGSFAFTDFNVLPPFNQPPLRSRFFTIDDGNNANDIQVTISGLTFTGSTDTTNNGGSILSHEDLVMTDITFTGNSTLGDGFNGGALYQRYGSLSLDGVVLTANTTDGVDADGGAIYVRDANATIANSVISGNSTTQTLGSGGGVYIRGGTLDMTYTTVASNLAPGGEADGGGISSNQGTLNISNSYITGNSMTGSNSEGAGIHALDSTLTLTDSYVSLNSTTGTQSEGAGIYLSGGSATIDRSNVSLNSTTGLVSTGGGIAVVNGELLFRQSTLDRNSTSGGIAAGGGIHNLGGEVTIVDSTLSGNTAGGLNSSGGAIYSDTTLGGSEKTLVVNSTVSGNSSSTSGGGIYNAGGLTEIRHSTITNNSVLFFGRGGGVSSLAVPATTTTRVYSSIIAGNFASNDPANPNSDVDSLAGLAQNSFVTLGYNVIGTGLSLALDGFNGVGDQVNRTDPMLGLLSFNGGLTLTHAPLENSPVVNAGNPADAAGLGSVPQFDQREAGFPRVLSGRIDVGAIESPFMEMDAADFDGDGDIDGADFLAWQRGFGNLAASRTDGDANLDGSVNTDDLSMWQAGYGMTSALAASMSGGAGAQLAAVSSSGEASEPLGVASVLSSDELLTGLIIESLSTSSNSSDEVIENGSAIAETVVVRDRLFASLSQRGDYRPPAAAEASEADSSEDELELTVEDQVFESLGA